MLEMQALRDFNSLLKYTNMGQHYSPPVKKITDTPILRRVDICKFQIKYIGTLSIAIIREHIKYS